VKKKKTFFLVEQNVTIKKFSFYQWIN